MSTSAGILILIGRLLAAGIFLYSAQNHIRNTKMMAGFAKASGFPLPQLAGWPAGVWLLASTVSVALGIWPDLGALMLAAFVPAATVYFHAFWKVTDDAAKRRTELMNFLRNLNWLGIYLALFALFSEADHALRFVITGSLIHLN